MVFLQCLRCRSSAWTWKSFMKCVRVITHYGQYRALHALWGLHTSCCLRWLLLWLKSFQVDLQKFLHPAAAMLQMSPPHYLHKNRYKWTSSNWHELRPAMAIMVFLTTAFIMQTSVSHDCLTRVAIRQGKWLYCTRNQGGELVCGSVYFSGLTQSSLIC